MKWVIQLREHEMEYLPHKAIKWQALTDFLVEMKWLQRSKKSLLPKNLQNYEGYLLMEHPIQGSVAQEC